MLAWLPFSQVPGREGLCLRGAATSLISRPPSCRATSGTQAAIILVLHLGDMSLLEPLGPRARGCLFWGEWDVWCVDPGAWTEALSMCGHGED